MKTIFVPTDLSNHAHFALRYALQMSKTVMAKKFIYFHHNPQPIISEIPVLYRDDQEAINNEVKAEMESILHKYMDEAHIPEDFMDIEILISNTPSSPSAALIETAEKHKANVIVMGSHGQTGLRKFIFGSVTQEVLERGRTPVLVIPKEYKFKPIDRVAFASSLTYFSKELHTILEFTDDLSCKIEIVHMDYGLLSGQLIDHAKRLVDKLNNSFVHLSIVSATPEDSLNENLKSWLRKNNPDWLVMFPSKRDWYEKMFLSSKSLELAREHEKPMLIIQKRED